jgi:hypothetical protein
MAEIFRLPGSSFEELSKIIASYGNVQGEASPNDVARLAAVDPTVISRNNAFLMSLELIEERKSRKKAVTDLGRDLGRAIEHGMTDRQQELWRQVALKNEFLKQLVSSVRIRNGMDAASFASHVAYSAGLPKSAATSTGARAVLGVLQAGGLVQAAEGRIVAVEIVSAEPYNPPNPPNRSTPGPTVQLEVSRDRIPTGVTVQIQVMIQAKPDELDGLGRRLRDLMAEIERFDDTDPPTDG